MATAHAKHHDYHLVDPSPWPVVGSISAFIMAVGAIGWMHNMFTGAPVFAPPVLQANLEAFAAAARGEPISLEPPGLRLS